MPLRNMLILFTIFLLITGCNQLESTDAASDPSFPTTTPPTADSDGDGISDDSDPCPDDRTNACQSGTPIANTVALNTALSKANGGEVFLLAPGDYGRLSLKKKFSSHVTIKSANLNNKARFTELRVSEASKVSFDGLIFDYVFKSGDKNVINKFSVMNSKDIVIRNSIFDGDFASGTGGPADGTGYGRGFKLRNSSNVSIVNSEFKNWWKGLNMGHGSNYKFVGNELYGIRSDGFNAGSVQGLTIEKNYFHDFGGAKGTGDHRDMIQILRSSGNGTSDIIIRNNIFDMASGDYTQTIWSGTDGSSARLTNVLIENNIIYNAHTNGIALHSVDGLSIRKNTMLRVPRAQTGGVTIPKINSSNSTNVLIELNVLHGISNPGTNWTIKNNVYVQDNSPRSASYYDNEFVYFAKTQTKGFNEFGIKPGGNTESLDAGSNIMKLYPIGQTSTISTLRSLP